MYSEAVKDLMWRIFVKSGLGAESTFLPAAIHPCHTKVRRAGCACPPDSHHAGTLTQPCRACPTTRARLPQTPSVTIDTAMAEAELVMGTVFADLLERTGALWLGLLQSCEACSAQRSVCSCPNVPRVRRHRPQA